MMDTQARDESATLSTVMDYAAAIQRVGSGQFISRLSKDGQRFFASFYGAPFFALSRLAPEALDKLDSSLLAADGGRWLLTRCMQAAEGLEKVLASPIRNIRFAVMSQIGCVIAGSSTTVNGKGLYGLLIMPKTSAGQSSQSHCSTP